MSTYTIDERDRELIAERLAARAQRTGPLVGDFVRFADGTLRRMSYHWTDGAGWDGGMQTSDGGSFHLLRSGGISMSGSLYSTVPTDSLKLTDETIEGSAWIFHHDMAGAGRGVDFMAPFPVYACPLDPPR